MKGKGKYISNLDLKLLGAKFITVPDSHLEMGSNLTEIRRSRGEELPSIFGTPSNLQCVEMGRKSSTMILPEGLELIDFKGGKTSSLGCSKSREKDYSEEQKREISKYRGMIDKFKKANDILHKEITNLYRQKKIHDNQPKTKPIKQIFKLGREELSSEVKPRIQTKQFNEIYERLNSEDNPYRQKGMEIQKQLSASNLHKNFEAFLQSHNRRVPDFIKQIR